MNPLILASTSASRKKVLQQLGLPFETIAPICDETPFPNEDPIALVQRLSEVKARSIANLYPEHIVIGSDQVGVLHQKIIGKPHHFEAAKKQLQKSSGQTLIFYTGLSVIHQTRGFCKTLYAPFEVTLRTLTEQEIEAYLHKDRPFHCAGSFKCDGLGITLFAHLNGEDLNSLVGLPLIQLNKILIELNANPLLV